MTVTIERKNSGAKKKKKTDEFRRQDIS